MIRRPLAAFVLASSIGCTITPEPSSIDFEAEAITRTIDPNNVLADADIEGRSDVTSAQVQSFLESKGSALATYWEGGKSAAQIIVDSGRAYGISPIYLLALIQTESSLITSGTLNGLRQATGAGCPDGSGCDPALATFTYQIVTAAKWMHEYFEELRTSGITRAGWRVGVAKWTLDGCLVTPANKATAALYTYTPHAGAYAIGCGGPWGGTSLVGVAFRLYAPAFPAAPAGSWSCARSSFSGAQIWTCDGSDRVRCEAGAPKREHCELGCLARPQGTDDLCISRASSWPCASSSYRGAQWWTCASDGALHECQGSAPAVPAIVRCPAGCTVGPLGTDDRCR